jgi:hypothetical protein
MFRRLLPACVLALILLPAAVAHAAGTAYTLQVGSITAHNTLAISGDTVSGFAVGFLDPQRCTNGNPAQSSDSTFKVALAPGASSPIIAGRFSFAGAAPPSGYSGSGGTYQVSGHVTGSGRVVTGTISLSGASDSFLQGCSGSYPFMAIRKPGRVANVDHFHSTFTSQFVSFDYRRGTITKLAVQANFLCGDGVDSAGFSNVAYGFGSIRAHGGRWSLQSYVLDEYGSIVHVAITGRLVSGRATGRSVVTEPAGLESVADERCHGNRAWTATKTGAASGGPLPAATFSWAAVRVPAGASYRYYFLITDLQCSGGASAVVLRVGGAPRRVRCSARQGWASGALSPGQTYQSSAEAVKLRGSRVVARGLVVAGPVQMPAATSTWRPVTGLPAPPS